MKVDCLTKKELLDEEKVRSKTMKVIVRAKDHEKAMNPDMEQPDNPSMGQEGGVSPVTWKCQVEHPSSRQE